MSLYVKIKKHLPAFELDVEFEAGSETVGFLGASGCGKSLTLRCIAGVEKPDEGRIVVNDRVFFDSDKKINLSPQKRKTALLFQNYQLFPNMTVLQNVEAGMDDKLSKEDARAEAKRMLGLFHLEAFENRYPMRLSGGQQQRVALARMLAAKPDILMLDEPFSALDSHLKATLEQQMLDVFDGFDGTILYVSHDIDEAYRLCDRIAVVSSGRIEELDTASNIVNHPGSLASLKLSGCKNISRAKKIDEHTLNACDWGVTLDVDPEIEIPDDLKYVGARASFLRPSDTEQGKNVYKLKVHRVVENRFDCLITLRPLDADNDVLIYWIMDKFESGHGHADPEHESDGIDAIDIPKEGDVIPMRFMAKHLHLVCK